MSFISFLLTFKENLAGIIILLISSVGLIFSCCFHPTITQYLTLINLSSYFMSISGEAIARCNSQRLSKLPKYKKVQTKQNNPTISATFRNS